MRISSTILTQYFLLMVSAAGLVGCKTLTSIKEIPGSSPIVVPASLRPDDAASVYRKAILKTSDSEKLGQFLKAAEMSLEALDSDESDRTVYNASCAEAALLAHKLSQKDESIVAIAGEDKIFEVELIDADSRNFLHQERIIPANRVQVKRLDQTAVLADGVGGTLVAYTRKENQLHVQDSNISSEGRALALTSLISFPEAGKARIEIHDPGLERDVTLGEKPYKLAGDFSTPLGYFGSQTVKGNIGLKAMTHSAKNEWIRGLTHFEPFEPDQIPVVFVHGLQSAPRVWKDAYLELIKDERIRENFQFWYYRYPTGYGIGLNAQEFRESFRQCIQKYDANGSNEALNQTVLVGHSMGGLLSSVSIRASESIVWNQIAETSPEELGVDEVTRERIKAIAFFEPLPQVSRAVFMATPHRGADMASGAVGRIGNRMIKLPRNLVEAGMTLDAAHGLTSLGLDSFGTKVTSIDFLKPNAWQLETLLSLPVSERVTMHSIIGRKKETEPLKESTDGVVPYWSSHIEDAVSELIVQSDHSVPEKPQAIEELRRILHLHLDEVGR